MPRRPALPVAMCATFLVFAALVPTAAFGQGYRPWLKFLFTPQAGMSSACLSCGWHNACVWPYSPGPALDFPASCSDAGDAVYFRSLGQMPDADGEYVAFGRPSTVPGGTCVETRVTILDKETYDVLGYMRYTHTYKTRSADMLMYADHNGTLNEDVFAGMAKDPSPDPPATPPPPEQAENEGCIAAGYWTGVHLHEYHEDGTITFVLRDGGDCTGGDKYPCAPGSGGPFDPQERGDWARALCSLTGDSDCDYSSDEDEDYLGTDPYDSCPDDSYDDAWPPDLSIDTWVDVGDMLMFKPHILCDVGDPCYDNRYDLVIDGSIDVGDILVYRLYILTSCA